VKLYNFLVTVCMRNSLVHTLNSYNGFLFLVKPMLGTHSSADRILKRGKDEKLRFPEQSKHQIREILYGTNGAKV
jgi:hypothetical protein